MLDFKKILFPVNLTGTGITIIPHLKAMAEKFDAEVWVMYVAKVNEYHIEGEEPGVSIKKTVEKFKAEHFKDIRNARIVVAEGDPVEAILSYIDAADIDLVIIPTRGRSAIDKAVFGSVPAKVARIAPAPVLFINPFNDKFLHPAIRHFRLQKE